MTLWTLDFMNYKHVPVMLNEVMEYLDPQPGQNFIDCTLGGAGYSLALAEKVGPKGIVLGIDLDPLAIANTEKIIKEKPIKNIILELGNFKDLYEIVKNKNEFTSNQPDIAWHGIVFDLGLSSAQLEDRSRGFSFKEDDALDMSFGNDPGLTKYIVNKYRVEQLEKIFRDFGEEKFSRRIAQAICRERQAQRIETTGQLVEIIARAVPAVYRNNRRLHFATRVFQALRIATNNELENLTQALPQALDLLASGGKIAVVSFHSLEDRIVKNYFRQESKDCICSKEEIICHCNHQARVKIINKHVIIPSNDELANNPRSSSAKLRVIQKI